MQRCFKRLVVGLPALLTIVTGCGSTAPPSAADTISSATAGVAGTHSYHMVVTATQKSGKIRTTDLVIQSPSTFVETLQDGTRFIGLDPSVYAFLPGAGGWGEFPRQIAASRRPTEYTDPAKLAHCLFSRLPSNVTTSQSTLDGQPVTVLSASYSGVQMSYDIAESGKPYPLRVEWQSAAAQETKPVDPVCADGTWPGANVATAFTTIVSGTITFDHWDETVVSATAPPQPYAWRANS